MFSFVTFITIRRQFTVRQHIGNMLAIDAQNDECRSMKLIVSHQKGKNNVQAAQFSDNRDFRSAGCAAHPDDGGAGTG
jgi:hypothetical protein